MGDDIVDLCTEDQSLKKKKGSFEEKWVEESETRILRQLIDDERANLIV